MQKVIKEHCNTQFAASIRSGSIFRCVLRNHIPIGSAINKMRNEIPICILILVENIRLSLSPFSFPNSKVKKRLMEDDNAPLITENIATTPPTTL